MHEHRDVLVRCGAWGKLPASSIMYCCPVSKWLIEETHIVFETKERGRVSYKDVTALGFNKMAASGKKRQEPRCILVV